MEIFIEKGSVEKILFDGTPQAVRFYAQLVFINVSKSEQELFGFKSDKRIVEIKGNVPYSDDPKNAIDNKINKIKQQYLDKLKVTTTQAVSVDGFDGNLSKLNEL